MIMPAERHTDQINGDTEKDNESTTADLKLGKITNSEIIPTLCRGEPVIQVPVCSPQATHTNPTNNDKDDYAIVAPMKTNHLSKDRLMMTFQGGEKRRNIKNIQYYSMESIQHRQDKEHLEDFEVFRQELEKITGCCRTSGLQKDHHQWNLCSCPPYSTSIIPNNPPKLQIEESTIQKVRRRSRSASSFKEFKKFDEFNEFNEFKKILEIGTTVGKGCCEVSTNCGAETQQMFYEGRHGRNKINLITSTCTDANHEEEDDDDVIGESNPIQTDSATSLAGGNSKHYSHINSPFYSTSAQSLDEIDFENCRKFNIIKMNDILRHHPITSSIHNYSPRRDQYDDVNKLSNHHRIVTLRQNLDVILARQKDELIDVLINQEAEWMQLEEKFGYEKIQEYRKKMRKRRRTNYVE